MSKHKNRGDRQRVHYNTKIKRIYRQSKRAVEKLSHTQATNRSTEVNEIPPWMVNLDLNHNIIPFKIDTGADVTVISKNHVHDNEK